MNDAASTMVRDDGRHCLNADKQPGCYAGPGVSACPPDGLEFPDPNRCRPGYLQNSFMKMVRGGVRWVRSPFEWGKIAPSSLSEPYRLEKYDAYVDLAGRYKIDILALHGETPAYAAECCDPSTDIATCNELIDREPVLRTQDPRACIVNPDDRSACTPLPSRVDCRNPDRACDIKMANFLLFYNRFVAPGLGPRAGAGDFARQSCAARCDPREDGSCTAPELRSYLTTLVNRYKSLGVRHWQIGAEAEGSHAFVTRKGVEFTAGFLPIGFCNQPQICHTWDPPIPPGQTRCCEAYLSSPSEYKKMYRAAYEAITQADPGAKVLAVGSNGVATGQTACPDWDGDGPAGAGQFEGDLHDLQHGCFGGMSAENFLELMANPVVGGYSMNDHLTFPNLIMSVHLYNWQHRVDLVDDIDEGAGGNAPERLHQLIGFISNRFPSREIWSTEAGWPLPLSDTDNTKARTPSIQAALLSSLYNLLTPGLYSGNQCIDKFECDKGAGTKPVSPNLKKIFWYIWPDIGGSIQPGSHFEWSMWQGPDLSVTSHPHDYPVLHPHPIYHAFSPPPNIPVIFGRSHLIMSGMDRGALLPRAYFHAKLGTSQKFTLIASSGTKFQITFARLNPDLSPAEPFRDVRQSPNPALLPPLCEPTLGPLSGSSGFFFLDCRSYSAAIYAFAVVPDGEPEAWLKGSTVWLDDPAIEIALLPE